MKRFTIGGTLCAVPALCALCEEQAIFDPFFPMAGEVTEVFGFRTRIRARLRLGGWVESSGPPPSKNSEGFLGWAPATPCFFGHRSLVWLVAGAPFRFVVVQAPCQKGKKKSFTPNVYTPYTRNFQENSIMDKSGHFSSHP